MRFLITLAAMALPLPALAEGARLTLDCAIERVCDTQNTCTPSYGSLRVTIAPVSTDAAGAGDYTVTAEDGSATVTPSPMPARAPARTGPWVWLEAGEVLVTLALTSETTALRIRQPVATGVAPGIDMMTCEVTA
ncbi:hypothetical protein [Frigidibacter sp. MR17.24]|uniref:hypothetical protein n=1 Tax=Frigidibacter sp. MR17.24 TaxID=3127345 RepID=UPI003012EE43